ncbi:MAG: hypothetical protein Fur0021_00050 [Candidatus Promineifilaceae bacterium]
MLCGGSIVSEGGVLPEMGQMRQLFQLFVSGNRLSKTLLAKLGNLRNLWN